MEQIKKPPRPILFDDIRYLECEGLVDTGAYHHYTGTLFQVPNQANARANRLAVLCSRAKVSITKRSLYLCFTPALLDDVIQPTDFRSQVWQRYVMYGLPLSFNALDEEARIEHIWRATIRSLRAIAPAEHIQAIEEAASVVEAGGEDLQFSLSSAKNKDYLAEVASTIPTWPKKAQLLLTLTERSSQVKRTCPLFESKLSDECGFLGGKTRIVDGQVIVGPKASSTGRYYAKRNKLSSFVVSIEALLEGRPSVVRSPYEEPED